MTDPNSANTVNRFDGLAGLYDRHRPDYPDAALDHIMTRCRLEPGRIAIDVGCGTGISTRQLAARALQVIGIGPNAEMRTLAESTPVPAKFRAPEFRDGPAE